MFACVTLFVAGAPALLAIRFARPQRMSWWLLLILAALSGWVFVNLYLHFYFEHLDDLLEAAGGIDRAPPDLVDEWQNDGGPRTFAFLFGWLYGLLYLGACTVVYSVLTVVRNTRRRNPDAAA
jgi:hypothetical protein